MSQTRKEKGKEPNVYFKKDEEKLNGKEGERSMERKGRRKEKDGKKTKKNQHKLEDEEEL